ncbi:MAG: ABC transporter permease [Gammaproteobacteria bacterium]|nr:ABC transporter permease [Gammaproteobacteria bacterium]
MATAHAAASFEVIGGQSLKSALARAERRNKLRALMLVLPLILFIAVTFLAPIALMMVRSFNNPVLIDIFPETVAALESWDPAGAPTPPEEVYATFAAELSRASKERTIGKAATRLNYELGGMRSLMTKTARQISRVQVGPFMEGRWKEKFLEIDDEWGDRVTWTTIKNTGVPYTLGYYLKSFDLQYDWDGSIVPEVKERRLYLLTGFDSVWARTFWISALVTVMCVLLGYPVAYLLANLPLRISNLLMILVLLPFWTSLLVRTTAWVVVLQTEGVLNDVMMFLGIIDERIQLIFNRFGVIVAMTHILLPFMILPIYSVMKTIPPSYERAARSLGATPWTAFWRVYFPQSLAGIGAGGLLVFILALGYYITPALVGGPTDQLVSYFIADHTNRSLNWGLASALGCVLLVGVLAVYLLYDKLVGIDNMKLG